MDGKVAVVTGGADGIGKGISSLFAAHGAVVEIVDQDEALLEKTVEAIQALGGKAHGFVGDVRDAGQVTEFKHEVMKRHATVDVLVNNVGDYRPLVRFLDSSPDSWKEMYDLSLIHI